MEETQFHRIEYLMAEHVTSGTLKPYASDSFGYPNRCEIIMPIKVTCSNCGGVLHAPDDAGGKRGRCPTCGNVLPIPAANAASTLPTAPADDGGNRPPSFGDFAMGGSTVAPRPAARPAPATVPPPPAARAAAGNFPETAPRKAATLPPPPAKPSRNEDRKEKKSPAWNSDEASEGLIRAWKRARGGLWWMRCAIFFLTIALVSLPTLTIAKQFAGPFSFIKPDGFLKMNGLSGEAELIAAIFAIPALLGVACLLFGRLGFARVPRRSYSRGVALLSALATMGIFAGVIALIFPPVVLLIQEGQVILKMFDLLGYEGLIQRVGIAMIVAGIIAGEVWFSSAIGRVGTALQSDRTAARATRYQFVMGLMLLIVLIIGAVNLSTPFDKTTTEPMTDLNKMVSAEWSKNVQTQWDKVGEYKPVVLNGVAILGVLILGFGYMRMVGAARGAIREWLDQHQTA